MAVYGSADVGFFLAGGYNLLGDLTTINDEYEALVEETTGLGDSYEESTYIGVKKWSLSQDGFYSDTALASNAALVVPGALKVICWAPEPNLTGNRFVGAPTIEAKYTRTMTRGALHKAHAEYLATGIHDEGKILAPLAARGAASDTHLTSVDNAASTANGGVGYLQLTSLTLGGYTNLVVKIQHSSDNSSFADLITFTAETAAPDGQRVTVAGTINRYTDALWTWTGSGSAQTATWFAGLARN